MTTADETLQILEVIVHEAITIKVIDRKNRLLAIWEHYAVGASTYLTDKVP